VAWAAVTASALASGRTAGPSTCLGGVMTATGLTVLAAMGWKAEEAVCQSMDGSFAGE